MENMEQIQLRLCEKPDEYTLFQLERLLEPMGVEIKLHTTSALLGNASAVLQINYERSKLRAVRTRNAGRKNRESALTISVQELEQIIMEQGSEQAAAMLGFSRATMYRRLKYAKEHGYSLIW